MKRSPAFTLIEILVVLALVAFASLPLFANFLRAQANQELRAGAEQLADTLTKAHIFSRESKNGALWAVTYSTNQEYLLESQSVEPESLEWVLLEKKQLPKTVTLRTHFSQIFEYGTGHAKNIQPIILDSSRGNSLSIEVLPTGVVDIVPLEPL